MEFPTLEQGKLSRENITRFGGYNAGARIGGGEFAQMENCSSDAFPLLATRPRRGVYASPAACHGLIAKDSLCWVDGSKFVMNGYETEMHLTDSPKQLVSMGAYVVIFPDKKYINTVDLTDRGSLEAEFLSSGPVRFTPADADGQTMIPAYIQSEEPQEPENGTLWLDNSGDGALLQWSAGSGMWVSVEATYVRVSAAGIGAAFRVGDALELSGGPEGVAAVGVAAALGQDYVLLPGLLEREQTVQTPVRLGRYVPEMDYVIQCGNRLWGCRYGPDRKGQTVNEIYASALGDFRNWQRFQGLSTDSYAVSLGADGPFTGAAEHLGYPVFFREGYIHKIYGSYPAAFRLQSTPCPGVQRGSAASLALVGQLLYYKSPAGVCAYDGAAPADVSQALGGRLYRDAAAGALRGKYYISMKDGAGQSHLFVYDSARGLWHREDDTRAACFCACREDLFFLTSAGQIVSVTGAGEPEGDFSWLAETGQIGAASPDCKYLTRLNLRLYLAQGAEMELWVRYDEEARWRRLASLQGRPLGSVTLPAPVRRCDHLRLRLTGRGEMRLYSLTKTMEQGSDVF